MQEVLQQTTVGKLFWIVDWIFTKTVNEKMLFNLRQEFKNTDHVRDLKLFI